jgi:subtilisin family serine protease
MRRLIVLIATGALLTGTLGPVAAQTGEAPDLASSKVIQRGEYNSYIVLMKADPLVVTEGENLDTNKARNRGQELRASHDRALRGAGIGSNKKTNDYVNALNGFSVLVTYEQAVEIAADPEVALVMPDELQQPMTDSSPDYIGISGPGEAWDTGVTGAGVVVGVIDTGIWPEHPSFADTGFSAPPTGPIPCEFGNTAHNPNDAAFSCNNKLIGARQMLTTYRALIGAEDWEFDSARDDNGHGTHTASTAAGNAGVNAEILGSPVGDGPISGIAPGAHVVAYKGLGALGGFTSDLAAAIDQAVLDGVDVINYSIGGGAGAPGADELAFLFAADAGVFAATSAGNSGPNPSTLGNPGTMPWLTTVGANTQSRFLAGTIELGNGATYEGASVTDGTGGVFPLVDAEDLGDDLCTPGELADATGKIVLCRRGAIARVAKSQAVMEAGGVGMIMYENDDFGNLFTDTHWVPSVHIDNTPGVAIKAYIDSAGAGATAEIRDTRQISTWESAPSMTSFSSRGPNFVGDVIKPDITAPGLQILAGNTPMPGPGAVTGQLFQAIAGTSMSSPHIAGAFALLKQAHPDWSPAAARSALMTTADPNVVDNDRTSPATPFEMGAGHVNPGQTGKKGSAFQPGLVYDAGFLDYLGFLCDAFPSVFANPAATCASLASAGIPTDASDLNYPSIAVAELAGSQTVTRTVTSVATENKALTYAVSVEAPDGFDVTVEPSSLTLRRGQSASYEVTIVNEGAALDAWYFGELTWTSAPSKGARYGVRSPIAVRPTQFDAPAVVTGTGESGAVSVDVSFGYTGDYDATAHGMVAATVTTDNVLQDPDQEFDPSDVGNGANLHEFALADAAVFRIAMPPESTEPDADLDVFVYNPSGTLAATSTAGGTNELITISDPADGTWKVYVHGWAAPGGDSDYTMWSWIVPDAADAGSLVIDSEPEDAQIGVVGTIEASWSGLTSGGLGDWYFGALGHWEGSDLLGRTLVEIDNR